MRRTAGHRLLGGGTGTRGSLASLRRRRSKQRPSADSEEDDAKKRHPSSGGRTAPSSSSLSSSRRRPFPASRAGLASAAARCRTRTPQRRGTGVHWSFRSTWRVVHGCVLLLHAILQSRRRRPRRRSPLNPAGLVLCCRRWCCALLPEPSSFRRRQAKRHALLDRIIAVACQARWSSVLWCSGYTPTRSAPPW